MNLFTQIIDAKQSSLSVSHPSFPLFAVGAMQLQDLPLEECSVDIHLSLRAVAKLLQQHPDWPGVILTARDQFVGLLSRTACSEFSDRPFGIEIFSKETLLDFYEKHASPSLVLDGSISVQQAVQQALNQEGASIDDPIVVRLGENQYRLLDAQVLLQQQSSLLEAPSCKMQQLLYRKN